MNRKIFLFVLLSALYLSISAQDPVFSQFYTHKMYLNPAFTGFHSGTSTNLNYRSQWGGVRSGYSKFETKGVAVSTYLPCKKSGFGLMYNESVAGEGLLKWQSVGTSYAFHLVNDGYNQRLSQLALGFGVTYNWRNLSWNNLVFSDQLEALAGVVGPSAYAPPQDFIAQSKPYWDLNVGGVYMIEEVKMNKNLIAEDLRVGVSMHHLVKNNTTLMGYNEYLPVRYTAHASWFNLLYEGANPDWNVYLNPSVRFDIQKASYNSQAFPFMSFAYGANVTTNGLFGGFYVQNRQVLPESFNTTSLVTMLGFGWDNENTYWRFGMSKDFNLTGFTNYGGGAWEASLIINPKKAMFCDPNSLKHRRWLQNRCKRWQ